MKDIKEHWHRSRAFRIGLSLALGYAVLLLCLDIVLLSYSAFDNTIGADIQVGLRAARRLLAHENLYRLEEINTLTNFQYAPAYALGYVVFTWLPFPVTVGLHFVLLHFGAYILLYLSWQRIFKEQAMPQAGVWSARLLPLWIVFYCFWNDLGFLNLFVLLGLFTTWLIEAVIKEKLGRAIMWAAILVLIKPYCAFVIAVPLLLGRGRFFLKLVLGTGLIYLLTAVMVSGIVGLEYGLRQHLAYFPYLLNLTQNFPWQRIAVPLLGYNHSILQTLIFLLGNSPSVYLVANLIKVFWLAPLFVLGVAYWRGRGKTNPLVLPRVAVELALALYLAALIWLDIVWEVTLGIVIFAYLLAVFENTIVKSILWILFVPYALSSLGLMASYIFFPAAANDPYPLLDLNARIPTTMIIVLFWYGLLLDRLFRHAKIWPRQSLVGN